MDKLEKITWKEAVSIEKSIDAYTIHIGYIPELERLYPDCAAVVISPEKAIGDLDAYLFVIIDDIEMEHAIGGYYERLAKR